MRHPLVSIVASLLVLAGCVRTTKVTPAVHPSARAAASPASTAAIRRIDGTAIAASLSGTVKLLTKSHAPLVSDQGGGIISDNSGGIISDNSGGIISDNSGGIVSNNSAGAVAKPGKGYRVAATGAESLLAGSTVRVFDAKGQQLADASGVPIAAKTDGKGGFKVSAKLPNEPLVLRVPLSTGGALEAFVIAPGVAAAQQVDVDTASSIGARYVLDKFVADDASRLARLPGSEVPVLKQAVAAGLDATSALATKAPGYVAAELVALADEVRAKDVGLDRELDHVKALLLGQIRLGGGRNALEVPLANPGAVLALPNGGLLISESGRIRRLHPDGTLEVYADPQFGTIKQSFPRIKQVLGAPDGHVYLRTLNQVFVISPDNQVSVLLGPSATGPSPLAGTAADALNPMVVSVGPDGTVWIAFEPLAADGGPMQLAAYPPGGGAPRLVDVGVDISNEHIDGMVAGANGALEFTQSGPSAPNAPHPRKLYRWSGSGAAVLRAPVVPGSLVGRGPDGSDVIYELHDDTVTRVGPDGTQRPLLGPGAGGEAEAVLLRGEPSFGADGTMYFSDQATALVRALLPDGSFKALAGFGGLVQGGNGPEIAANGPFGAAWDDQGRLLISEAGSGHINRYDGQSYDTLAGTLFGHTGDGGPASQARLGRLAGMALSKGALYVAENQFRAVRMIDAQGTLSTLVGEGASIQPVGPALPTADQNLGEFSGLAVGPDGSVYFASLTRRQVYRISPDHRTLNVVAGANTKDVGLGAPPAPGAAATETPLGMPMGLALDAQGRLLLADLLGECLYRITDPAGARPTLERIAGLGLAASLARGDAGLDPEGVQAKEALLYGPAGVCVGPDGSTYVADAGSTNLGRLTISGVDANLLSAQFGVSQAPPRIRRIHPDGTITTVAGPGSRYFTDPNAEDALVLPAAMALSADGRLAIVDLGANTIRLLPAGTF